MKAEGSGTIDRRRSAARVLGPLAALVVSVALTGEPAGSSAGTSPSWLAQVTGDIRRMEYRFQPTEDGAWSAPSRAHDLRSRIDEGGLALTSRTRGEAAWKLGLCVRGFGRAGSVKEIEGAVLHADGDRIELRRYGLDEWYVNDEKGLEQGFTVYAPPGEGKPEAPLVIEMGLDGSMGAYPSADGREVLFKAADRPVLRYSELRVKDATGGDVPARLAFAPASLRIMIDDRDAVYPIEVDPVLSSPFWIAEGNQASAFFGFSVGTAGDVDGDGYSDVIVGAYGYDNGEPAEGVAFVYLGSASGPPTTPGWMAQSNQASSAFGTSVGTAGDVNGDGYDDVIVGAPLWSNGNTNEGGAFVWYGHPEGLGPDGTPASANWSAEGGQDGAHLGQAVGTAGDVNGDGYDDVIVGANQYTNGQTSEGRAFVFRGSASGLSTLPSWTAESDQANAELGISVGTAGDVNGDGYSDVIVGAWLYDNGQVDEGAAFVYLGSAGGLSPAPSWTAESNQADARMGRSVAMAGDVNGDGYSDVIVGTPRYDGGQPDEGRAWVYEGGAAGLSATPVWAAGGSFSGANFGLVVGTAGDVNGDGYADLIVGAPHNHPEGGVVGSVFVYLGSAAGPSSIPAWIVDGDQTNAEFGIAAATAGDVNGDGYSDVIVGADLYDSGQTDEGRAIIYLGSTGGLTSAVPTHVLDLGQAGAALGVSVATAGDVNGDGYSDLILGAPTYDNGQTDEGGAFVFLGSPAGPRAVPDWTAEANQASANFGVSVASAGDVNGDGYSDVIVGADLYDATAEGDDKGSAFVWYGGASGLGPNGTPANADWSARENVSGSQFGHSVGSAGDVNGDGFGDVIIGAPGTAKTYAWNGSVAGLGPNGTPANADWSVSGTAGSGFGTSGATAGDVNRDGFSDVVVGAPFFSNGQAAEGKVFVYQGSASGPSTAPDRVFEVNLANAHLGASVASAGDVNGDGYSDVILGAPDYSTVSMQAGAAFVWYGSAAGLGTPNWLSSGTGKFGSSVASAGDVNGDGYSDVVVGEPLYDYVPVPGQYNDDGAAHVFYGSATGLAGSAAWDRESYQTSAFLGSSVAAAGDVNGDGFGDLVVGASGYDSGGTDTGLAFLFYGGATMGLDRAPLQIRADGTAPIHLLGQSDAERAFRLRAIGRTAAGRGRVRLEWQNDVLGIPLDPAVIQRGTVQDTGFPSVDGGSSVLLEENASASATGVQHWRLRLASRSPFFPRTPWSTLPYNAASEADFRTAVNAAPFVVSVDPPDASEGQDVSADVTVTFSEPMLATSITTSTFQLLGPGGPVPATVSVSPSGTQAALDPSSALSSNTLYTVQVTSSAADLAGNSALPFGSVFTTGAPTPPAGTPLPSISEQALPPPSASMAMNGTAVAAAGDLDGNGLQDFISGAPGYQVGANADAGAAIVYLGSASSSERVSPDIVFTGTAAGERAGMSVAGNFDFNGDGVRDFLIGAWPANGSGPGKVYLVYFDPTDAVHYPELGNPTFSDTVSLSLVGQPGGIPGVVFTGIANGDRAGFSVAGADARTIGPQPLPARILIGAPGRDVTRVSETVSTDAGAAYLIYATSPPLSGTVSLDRVENGLDIMD